MALPVFNIAITPQYGASRNSKPRFKKIQFGDGYQQRSSDGLNTNLKTYSLSFKGDPALVKQVEDFLGARAANGLEAFEWTTPEGTVIAVTCEEWGYTFDNYGWSTLSATFNQVAEK